MNGSDCYVELRGNKEVFIDGMSTILEYSQTKITVLVKKQKISIKGESLILLTMNDCRISIEGKIKALEYISDEKIST